MNHVYIYLLNFSKGIKQSFFIGPTLMQGFIIYDFAIKILQLYSNDKSPVFVVVDFVHFLP